MFSKKVMLIVLLVGLLAAVAACGAQPAPQTIIQTVVVTKEVQGETVKVVETVEVVVTPTPEPPPAPETFSPEYKSPDTYVAITGAGEPETLDPAWTYETAGGATEANIYEGLVWFDREKYDKFIPALATDWKMDDSGKQWVFNIRQGVKFHKGGTLEPHDVAYSNVRSMLQGRIDGYQWILYEAFFGSDLATASIKDFALAYLKKDTETTKFEDLTPAELGQVCEAVKAAVVADDQAGTVAYNLNQPVPWLMALMAQQFLGGIVDQEWMVENGDWDGDCATWQKWADPPAEGTILFKEGNGTGPYALDHWTPGEEIVLTAFEDYWRTEPMWEGGPSGPAKIKRVLIKNIPEWGTRLSMFQAGDADFIYVPAAYRAQLEPYAKVMCEADGACQDANANGYMQTYRSLPQAAITPAQLNWQINVEGGNAYVGSGQLDGNGIPPDFFSDIHVRKAFNYCFNFPAMIEDALSNDGVQAQGPIPMGMMGYIEGAPPAYTYDLAKCEEEFKLADLDKDGVPAGEDEDDVWSNGFYFQIGYNTGNDTRRLSSEILKAGIEEVNPKFNIGVVGMPWPVLLNSRRAGKLPIYVGGWVEDYHDPHNWAQPFLYSQGSYGRIVNMPKEVADQFDALILKGATLTDPAQRKPIYEEIQRMSQEKAVNVWMYQQLERLHFQTWIKGYYFNPAYQQSEYNWIYALSKEQ